MGNNRYTYVVIAVSGFIILIVFVFSAGTNEKKISSQLNILLNETIMEKEQLQDNLVQVEAKIREKDAQLARLSDVQAIQNSLNNARKSMDDLNKELARSMNERVAIQENNINLKTRLENTTREYARITEELKTAKGELGKTQSGSRGVWQKRAEDYEKATELKNQQIEQLKADLVKLQADSSDLIKINDGLEKKMRDWGAKGGQSAVQDVNAVRLQEDIRQLKIILQQKDSQIQQLGLELSKLGSVSNKENLELTGRQKFYESIDTANKELKKEISGLERELAASRNEVTRSSANGDTKKITALYENAKEQVSRLTDLLLKKEREIDLARKETLETKEKLFNIQVKLSSLESNLAASKGNDTRLQELEGQNLSLQAKLDELQGALSKKMELSNSLQKNMEFLTQQLAKKENELKIFESRVLNADSSTKADLEREKARYDEINLLYNSLKTQVSQFSDALSQKDNEFEQRRKESMTLKEEIAELKSRSADLERELADAKQRQKKTLEDLVESVKLNALLQENKTSVVLPKEIPKPDSAGKEKADEMKRRIEVILEPLANNPTR